MLMNEVFGLPGSFEVLVVTNIGSLADFRIARAPGESLISPRSTLKWSYASRISCESLGGKIEVVIRFCIFWDFS